MAACGGGRLGVSTPSLLIVIIGLAATAPLVAAITGRATWYDDSPSMSVHTGSCMYGYLGDRFGGVQNWHVSAMNDGNPEYSGSCGRCYEIKCVPGAFSDAMGNHLDRTDACISQEPVIVAITDTCPCYKPGNLYSNKRWCCGDMPHFDMGVWAFRKLADPSKGVIMIDYHAVSCPSHWDGSLSSGQTSSSLGTQYPSGDGANKDGQSQVTAFSGPPDSTAANPGSPPPPYWLSPASPKSSPSPAKAPAASPPYWQSPSPPSSASPHNSPSPSSGRPPSPPYSSSPYHQG